LDFLLNIITVISNQRGWKGQKCRTRWNAPYVQALQQ